LSQGSISTHDDDGVTNDDDSKVECSPHNSGVDVALHNDKAIQQDAAQQQEHAQGSISRQTMVVPQMMMTARKNAHHTTHGCHRC